VVEAVNVVPGDEVTAGQVLATVVNRNGRTFEVWAPVAGEVVYVYARPGRQTELGEPLAILQPDSTRIARAFIPADKAETITEGMSAWVSPNSAPRGQYGFIEGVVESVAPAPTTREHLLAVLGDNAALADYLLSNGPVQEITVSLNIADTPSGYAWTIGDGPPFPIASSTLALVAVVKSQRSVASWLLP
jgi:HlyD family secretion protein